MDLFSPGNLTAGFVADNLTAVRDKLGVSNRLELIPFAQRCGLAKAPGRKSADKHGQVTPGARTLTVRSTPRRPRPGHATPAPASRAQSPAARR